MDGNDIAALTVFGADWLIFAVAMVQAFRVFPQKRKRFFGMLVAGLCSSMLYVTVSVAVYQFGANKLWLLLGTSGWYIMIICSNFVYATRIKSLGLFGGRVDRVAAATPWFFLFLLTPILALSLLGPFLPINGSTAAVKTASFVLAVVLSACIAVGEIFLFVVLLKKVREILEFRDDVRKRLVVELSVAVAILVALEVALLVSKFLPNNVDRILRPLVYLLRYFLVIRFYDELLEDINQAYLTDIEAFEFGQAFNIASKEAKLDAAHASAASRSDAATE